MDIRDYVKASCAFAWGGINGEDCTTWCATYAQHLTGLDPAKGFRGTYSDRAGAQRLIAKHDGLFKLVAPVLLDQGWKRVQSPETGDMAIIHTGTRLIEGEVIMGNVCALRFGPLWSVMGEAGPGGIADRKARLVACWRWCE